MKYSEHLPEQQLLYSRKKAAALLGTSTATLIRLEKAGRLTAVKLTESRTAQTYYRRAEVEALADPQRVVVDT